MFGFGVFSLTKKLKCNKMFVLNKNIHSIVFCKFDINRSNLFPKNLDKIPLSDGIKKICLNKLNKKIEVTLKNDKIVI